MYIETGCGVAKGDDPFSVGQKAARHALGTIKTYPLSVVIVFASVHYNLEKLLSGIRSITGDAPLIGTTTAGEICNETYEKSAVVAVLASPYLAVRVGIGQNVSLNWQDAVSEALAAPDLLPFFSPHYNVIWNEITQQGKSVFAMLFSPGNTRYVDSKSFEITEELKQRSLGRIPIVGGASADDWLMESNFVLSGDHVYADSILVALFETSLKFGIAMAHGFQETAKRVVITSVEGHEIISLDGKPAADVYARLVGIPRASLEGKHLTLATGCPLGVKDTVGQYNLSVASFFTPRGGIRITQLLPEGTTLTVMEPVKDAMVLAGQTAIRKAVLRSGISSPTINIIFSCALRSRILKERAREEVLKTSALIPSVPVVGFCSFGEQGLSDDGISRHNNWIVAALLLGDELSYSAHVAQENQNLRQELEMRIGEIEMERQALKTSEERYRVLLDNAGDAIFIADPEGNFVEINKKAEELLGYTRRELLGMNLTQIHPKEELERVKLAFKEMGEGQLRFGSDIKVLKKDGTFVAVDITGIAIEYAGKKVVHGIFRDIAERKQAEKKLKEYNEQLERLVVERTMKLKRSEKTYRDLVDNALVGIYKTNLKGEHLYLNEAMARIFEFGSLEDLLSTPVFERYKDPADRKAFIKSLKKDHKLTNYEVQMVTRTGKIKNILLNAIIEGNEISGMMLDITDRKQFEQDLKMKSLNLEELNTALKVLLEQRERDKSELEDKIFQNIKGFVLPYIDALKQRRLDAQQEMYLDIIEKNMGKIISPFMQKMNSINGSLTPTEIKVANLIRDGKTAKEIAGIFCVAETSINTLKQRIRNKLGLTHQKTSLKTYLMSLK